MRDYSASSPQLLHSKGDSTECRPSEIARQLRGRLVSLSDGVK